MNTIYWTPRTYYILENIVTEKKYLGQTTKFVGVDYFGSGTYWKNHCEKYGGISSKTVKVVFSKYFEKRQLAERWLRSFEKKNPKYWLLDEWANQVPETIEDSPFLGPFVNRKRIETGTHNFLGESNPVHKRVESGELSAATFEMNRKRVEAGIHHWLGESNPSHKRIKEGTHNFIGLNEKRVENGSHNFLKIQCVDLFGNTVSIEKERYENIKASSDSDKNKPYVHINSKEGKRRRNASG